MLVKPNAGGTTFMSTHSLRPTSTKTTTTSNEHTSNPCLKTTVDVRSVLLLWKPNFSCEFQSSIQVELLTQPTTGTRKIERSFVKGSPTGSRQLPSMQVLNGTLCTAVVAENPVLSDWLQQRKMSFHYEEKNDQGSMGHLCWCSCWYSLMAFTIGQFLGFAN